MIRRLVVAVLLTYLGFTIAQGAQQESAPFSETDMVGIWETQTCGSGRLLGPDATNDNGIFFKRRYYFTEETWSGEYTFYTDNTCRVPLFIAVFAGPYTLGPVVETELLAREGNFNIEEQFLMIQNPTLLEQVQMCGAGSWELWVQQNTTEGGCPTHSGFLQAPEDYPLDHDIVSVREGYLYPGFRTGNMGIPEGRPTELQHAVGAKKIQ
jgi:hypothetical protein